MANSECTHMRVGKEPCVACGGKRESDTKDPSTLDKAFSAGWAVIKSGMNPRLPKEGSMDGVLSRNPDPPAMNAGMPRDPDLLARLKRMKERKDKEIQKSTGLGNSSAKRCDCSLCGSPLGVYDSLTGGWAHYECVDDHDEDVKTWQGENV